MDAKYSAHVKQVLYQCNDEAVRLGNSFIGLEHIFLVIIADPTDIVTSILKKMGLDTDAFRCKLEASIKNNVPAEDVDRNNISFTKQAERAMKFTYVIAKELRSAEITTGHLMLSILHDRNNIVSQNLEYENIDYNSFRQILLNETKPAAERADEQTRIPEAMMENYFEDEDKDPVIPQQRKAANPKSKTPVLDNFGRDLTKAAEENRLDPIVGRDKELERIAQVLSRRKKNNPILIGEAGVGKSAIAEGLALRIVKRTVPRVLVNKRVIMLDLASVVAGTKYRGQFEERMKAIINELEKNRDIILFIDEIHTLVGAGNANGSLDASNMFKPALARGEMQVIGSTTLDEYRQYIEKDSALSRRFQKILVEPTTVDETIQILENIKSKYEDHHLVRYTHEAIEACVKLTNRYISDRFLPDKAIDALDEAGSCVHLDNLRTPTEIIDLEQKIADIRKLKQDVINVQKFEEASIFRKEEVKLMDELEQAKKRWESEEDTNRTTVDEQDVAKVVAMMTGVPVQRIAQNEGERLLKMGEVLEGKVIGQDEAIRKVAKAIRRNRAGLKDPNKPIGSFIFLGPTGVGKTYLAKVLAKYLFDSEDALVRIDMSEYMEKFAVSRLVGAPPGYVGYEEGGQLTEKVHRKPYSIVLLDEIEKAHPDVFHLLLQVLDDGQLTDSTGRKIDFKNTIIIMTSNIGSRQLKDFGDGVGFNTPATEGNRDRHAQSVIENALKRSFAPEFLNRIDDVIVFNSLKKDDICKIIDIELDSIYTRLKEMNLKLTLTDSAKDFIIAKGWDEKYGARPLKRAIQRYIEDPLADEIIIRGESVNEFIFDLKDGFDELTITSKKAHQRKQITVK